MNDFLRRVLFLPPQASTVAPELDALHYFVIGTTIIGASLVTLIGAYFLLRYKRPGSDPVYSALAGLASPPRGPRGQIPLWLELAVIGGLLALFLFWWWIGFRQFMRLRVAPEGALEIYVTGKKWIWSFAYPEGGGSVSTLYVPAGRPIKILLTSRDVIHSFYVPDFRVKQDAVPGRFTTLWFEARSPGTHDIFCAEYCGTGHSTMRGQVVVLSGEDYARWLEDRTPPTRGPLAQLEPQVLGDVAPQVLSMSDRGAEVAAAHGCLRCHTADGAPHIGPTFASLYGQPLSLADGGSVTADEAYLTESMMDPLAKLRRGFGPVMPSYRGLLPPADAAAIVEYIKSLREVPAQPRVPLFQPAPKSAPAPEAAP